MIRVHTTVFIAFPTVHTNTPRIRMAVAPHQVLVKIVETFWNFPSILLGQQFVKQNCPTTRLYVPAESKIFSPLLAVCSSQIVDMRS